MEWTQLISGIGIGAVATKLLDIFWLQDRLQEHQRTTWLRDKRLDAFTDVTKELLSFGLHDSGLRSAFQSYGAIARALLLIEDDGLVKRIDQFIVDLDRLSNPIKDSDKKESDKLYEGLVKEAREITRLLRNIVIYP